jgi:hypothetical protein
MAFPFAAVLTPDKDIDQWFHPATKKAQPASDPDHYVGVSATTSIDYNVRGLAQAFDSTFRGVFPSLRV